MFERLATQKKNETMHAFEYAMMAIYKKRGTWADQSGIVHVMMS